MCHPSVNLALKRIYWIIRCVTLQLSLHWKRFSELSGDFWLIHPDLSGEVQHTRQSSVKRMSTVTLLNALEAMCVKELLFRSKSFSWWEPWISDTGKWPRGFLDKLKNFKWPRFRNEQDSTKFMRLCCRLRICNLRSEAKQWETILFNKL